MSRAQTSLASRPAVRVAARWIARLTSWRAILAWSALLALGVLAMLAAAASHWPSWYRPAPVDAGRLDQDKRDFVNMLDAIGAALNAGRPVSLQLSEAQVNRWLAARHELPVLEVNWRPLEDPVVRFEPGAVLLGARVRLGRADAVISARLHGREQGDRLEVTCESVYCGGLRIPVRWVGSNVRKWLLRNRAVEFDFADLRLNLRNQFVWPNGKAPFRIAQVRHAARGLDLALEPLRTRGPRSAALPPARESSARQAGKGAARVNP